MTAPHQRSGLTQGVPLLIDPQWSPAQAMAVIELLDDLRNRIWAHYEVALHNSCREDRISHCNQPVTEPPF